MVGVAQLVRAPDCGSGGRGFDPRHSPHFFFQKPLQNESLRRVGIAPCADEVAPGLRIPSEPLIFPQVNPSDLQLVYSRQELSGHKDPQLLG